MIMMALVPLARATDRLTVSQASKWCYKSCFQFKVPFDLLPVLPHDLALFSHRTVVSQPGWFLA